MRQSQLFTRTIKNLPKDETSFNAQTLIRAGFVNKLGAGIYTFLPLGLRVLNKITKIVREEMDAVGGQEILMPALTPKENWQTTNRWDNFDALFRLKGSDGKEYALGATHEEIVTPLAQAYTFSYKELPFSVYQIQTKFRNEKRAKAGLIRGREFLMKDLYSFHADQADLDAYYEKVKDAYFKMYKRLGLEDQTYLTYSSGGAFCKYSHEFQTLTSAGEDNIYICDKCRLAINREIIEEQKVCPECGNSVLREERAIEVGNIFKLGTRFSEPFKFYYTDSAGSKNPVIMGCYGFGPSRVMGTIVELYHDDKGLTWPSAVAPFAIHLLSLQQNEAADKLYQELSAAGFEVLYDDRATANGEKFADADLIGCPWRLVVSAKTLAAGMVEVKSRLIQETEMVPLDKLIDYLKTIIC
jgi:prolyl-tRNA synthetase